MIIFFSPGMLLREWISVEVGRIDSWWVYGDNGKKIEWEERKGEGRSEGLSLGII